MSQPAAQGASQKAVKTAITPTRAQDFPLWYQEVVKAADMAENSPTRGCMIIKPYGYALWENMQRVFDAMIKEEGVENAYFPLLIPVSFLAREAEHVDGFAKECAVVTHHRLQADGEGGLVPASPLEEPYVIRPTSETIIGDAMARWVQSYRDLPLKINQWCNVMRWEMRTRLFLRTSEFLWQEGHNAFETAEQANADARRMLEVYTDFVENSLALPVIKGEKTADERFPGAVHTYSIESMMQDGKALQSGTSHDLGQNFSKSCGIKFQSRTGAEEFAHTTSWGISTRLIGAMIMTHADDDGMIMPPKVAPQQVVIIPVLRDDAQADAIVDFCKDVAAKLKKQGFRATVDTSAARTPDKMWAAVKKGVPVRVEIGQREMEEGALTSVRRDIGRDSKKTEPVESFISSLPETLQSIQDTLLERARGYLNERMHETDKAEDVVKFFTDKKQTLGFLKIPTSLLSDPVVEKVMSDNAITTRNMPFEDNGLKAVIGKSY